MAREFEPIILFRPETDEARERQLAGAARFGMQDWLRIWQEN